MSHWWKIVAVLALLACAPLLACAQASQSGSDTIVFINGERLAGSFVRATGSSVTFKSDALGNLTIAWSKVRELDTAGKVAVIRKGVKFRRKHIPLDIPIGTLVMQDQKLQITPAAGSPVQSIPVADAAVILDDPTFEKAANRSPRIFSDWAGLLTFGATLVQATQKSRNFAAGVSLVRAEPVEDWLNPSYRTLLNYSQSYGKLMQPGTPAIKTSIYHAAAEQDQYFTSALFAFAQAAFDHNFSQGLDLQQTYNGGIGWTALRTPVQQLELKASASYVRQQFLAESNGVQPPSQNLAGSVLTEQYHRNLPRGTQLDQNLSFTPAWNNTKAYSAALGTVFKAPIYKHLGWSASASDTFLNDPPAGFQKNSVQVTAGLTYSLR